MPRKIEPTIVPAADFKFVFFGVCFGPRAACRSVRCRTCVGGGGGGRSFARRAGPGVAVLGPLQLVRPAPSASHSPTHPSDHSSTHPFKLPITHPPSTPFTEPPTRPRSHTSIQFARLPARLPTSSSSSALGVADDTMQSHHGVAHYDGQKRCPTNVPGVPTNVPVVNVSAKTAEKRCPTNVPAVPANVPGR